MDLASLQNIYSNRFEHQSEYRNRIWRVLAQVFFQQIIPADAEVLDMGCGYGHFVNNIVAKKKYAMDLNPKSRQHLERDVAFFEQDCSQRWPLADDSLDVVFTSNFFEHMPSKLSLQESVREACRCLRPGGILIAMGPNARIVPGDYWNFWDHHIALTDLSMIELFRLAGLAIDRVEPRFLPYTMVDKIQSPMALVKIYLKVPMAWRIFGHQFLIIGRKVKAEECPERARLRVPTDPVSPEA